MTELKRIAIRQIGAIHFIIIVKSVLLLNLAPSAQASSKIVFGLMKKPTKIQVIRATIGISTLLLMKSHASRMDMPSGLMKSQTPKPREDGIPINITYTKTMIQVILRPHLNLSIKIETIVSISEIEEVNAAKKTSRKKMAPRISPIGILLNTFGRVMNIREGPAFKFSKFPSEKMKTEGTIIRPAKNAKPVSKNSICLTEVSRFVSFFI